MNNDALVSAKGCVMNDDAPVRAQECAGVLASIGDALYNWREMETTGNCSITREISGLMRAVANYRWYFGPRITK